MKITVLCKVVDNFGDIGVVYRLVKQLESENPDIEFNLVVDDLVSFHKINNQINPTLKFQKLNSINVYSWNAFNFCYEQFLQNDGEKLQIILEMFQCGRPDWMEKILFETKLNRTVQIIMVDYLTAEKYAEDFHCLQSLTRSAKVKKINFMPGFTEKTGGLTIDEKWKQLPVYKKDGEILFFCYDRNWSFLKNAICNVCGDKKVFVAQGKGHDTFINSDCKNRINYEDLPFLNQNEWDELMKNCSVLFIRGEESMSRACLSGIPFIWHAYPQSDEYQLVKVRALLERMKRHFKNDDFDVVEKLTLAFNQPEKDVDEKEIQQLTENFLQKSELIQYGYSDFALDLRKNGDLATNLMTLIEKIGIIE